MRRCGAFLRSAKMLRRACSQQLPPPESWAHDLTLRDSEIGGLDGNRRSRNSHCR